MLYYYLYLVRYIDLIFVVLFLLFLYEISDFDCLNFALKWEHLVFC